MKKKICLLLALSVIIGILLAILMINCFYQYVIVDQPFANSSDSIALFKTGAPVWIYSAICIWAVLFITVAPIFYIKKCDLSGGLNNNVFQIFSTSLLGFLFAGYVFN